MKRVISFSLLLMCFPAFTTFAQTDHPYIENGEILGMGIPILGDWDGDPHTVSSILYWAPVNCGYENDGLVGTKYDHRMGKKYQWGAGDTNVNTHVLANSAYEDTELIHWPHLVGSTKDRWNNNRGPCPKGWRLPTQHEFKILSRQYKGGLYNYAGNVQSYFGVFFYGYNKQEKGPCVFFPIVGDGLYLDLGGYELNSVYWSSTPLNDFKEGYGYHSEEERSVSYRASGLGLGVLKNDNKYSVFVSGYNGVDLYKRYDANYVRCVSE